MSLNRRGNKPYRKEKQAGIESFFFSGGSLKKRSEPLKEVPLPISNANTKDIFKTLSGTSSQSFEDNGDCDLQEISMPKNFRVQSVPRPAAFSKKVSTSSISRQQLKRPFDSIGSYSSTQQKDEEEPEIVIVSKLKPSLVLTNHGTFSQHLGSKPASPAAEKSPQPSFDFEGLMSSVKPRAPKKLAIKYKPMTKSSSSMFQWSAEQQAVIDCVLDQDLNVFYTGSAGTGKSALTRELIRQLRQKHGESAVAVTASTGLAAVNIGGTTLHKFAGIGIGVGDAKHLVGKVLSNNQTKQVWNQTKVLIIDEISMVDVTYFEKLDAVAQGVRKIRKPFGGIQIVLTGDFYQLPPVSQNTQKKFCFQSTVWSQLVQKTVLLTEVFRQQGDQRLIHMLNAVRVGQLTPEIIQDFKSLCRPVVYEDGIMPTELYPLRHEVQRANENRLRQLEGFPRTYTAKDMLKQSQNPGDLVQLDKTVMAVKELVLKKGAQVLMLKNMDESVANGSIGKVMFFLPTGIWDAIRETLSEREMEDQDILNGVDCISAIFDNAPEDVLDSMWNSLKESVRERLLFHWSFSQNVPKNTPVYPVVRFSLGSHTSRSAFRAITPDTFVLESPGKTLAEREQLPLLLSWALSIHKSQGQTLPRVKVDLGRIFEDGQAYVALSRAVSADTLEVRNFDPSKVRVSRLVAEFYQRMGKA
ncbi:unnamed protein product [Kuraishia capsulata CBS 1993]|uniref:ATP-dependent DNA helicase PIF1 n=1 Tax=Kuraishia capsulata CBS 1993 TaxID=1382522 RepID=W6MM08_9ASCO|nr:uncharacterized protein KUCA_T00003542001 [Kuraishia capsulata CBS 1993]CDK27564.1 unnamed protein product [Kuraishia capsulata CBS 1993]